MTGAMFRFIYNLLFPIGLLLYLPRQLVKMFRRGNYRENFGQRLGIYDSETRARLSDGGRTWIHAVSVGEVRIALKLIAQLRELEPATRFALTTTTSTGYAVALKAADQSIEVMYNAIDFWPAIRSAFRAIQPQRIILVEAEVWPNLVSIAHNHHVPIALVNARLSSRSEARFRMFRAVVAPIFRSLDLVCVPERRDVSRWVALGVQQERIRCVGSIKFDVVQSAPRGVNRLHENRPVLFGGSTHAGEEEILALAFQRLRREFPNLLLVIAPRHVERTREIRGRLEAQGLGVALRSDTNIPVRDCLLIDTTGELQDWYAIATVVFVGKSVMARGGQNPVEPIIAGKPVLFGPHMENFQPLADSLVESHGAIRVTDVDSLVSEAGHLLHEPARAAKLVENARTALAAHTGATHRTAELLVALQPGRD
ncbi:MAG: 3-deoxy-D-manno-octulosonic acid transferase [Chthoniobacterales bacterium]